MIKNQWDRYWEKEAPLLGEMMGFSEGDHSPLVAEYIHTIANILTTPLPWLKTFIKTHHLGT